MDPHTSLLTTSKVIYTLTATMSDMNLEWLHINMPRRAISRLLDTPVTIRLPMGQVYLTKVLLVMRHNLLHYPMHTTTTLTRHLRACELLAKVWIIGSHMDKTIPRHQILLFSRTLLRHSQQHHQQ